MEFSVRRANSPRYSLGCVQFNALVHTELALCQSEGYLAEVRRQAQGVETRQHSLRICGPALVADGATLGFNLLPVMTI